QGVRGGRHRRHELAAGGGGGRLPAGRPRAAGGHLRVARVQGVVRVPGGGAGAGAAAVRPLGARGGQARVTANACPGGLRGGSNARPARGSVRGLTTYLAPVKGTGAT